jgi:hypothetical protein
MQAQIFLKVHLRGYSRFENRLWIIFDFTVRGFTILGCRWQPQSDSTPPTERALTRLCQT